MEIITEPYLILLWVLSIPGIFLVVFGIFAIYISIRNYYYKWIKKKKETHDTIELSVVDHFQDYALWPSMWSKTDLAEPYIRFALINMKTYKIIDIGQYNVIDLERAMWRNHGHHHRYHIEQEYQKMQDKKKRKKDQK